MTSQSTLTCRSPKPERFVTARSERPIRRWISCVRPEPAARARSMRLSVERGSMPYSPVTQPRPLLRRKGGTESSTLAVQSTWVSPNLARQEPSAYLRSEEHTSELQSLMRISYAVFCLKNKTTHKHRI